MNLHEEIRRMHSMMDLTEASPMMSLKRRVDELPRFVKSAFEVLNPKAFDSLGEFIERVVLSTIREFMAEFDIDNHEQKLEIIGDLKKSLRDYILDNHLQEIHDYYMKEKGYGD
jgi:DNA-binding ferritin-like protein (Dps family)